MGLFPTHKYERKRHFVSMNVPGLLFIAIVVFALALPLILGLFGRLTA